MKINNLPLESSTFRERCRNASLDDVICNIFISERQRSAGRACRMIDAKYRGLIRPYIFIQLVGGGFYIPGHRTEGRKENERQREKCRGGEDGAA